ncbi:MAG: hypothetical protein ACOZBW_09440 [Thermodesulfobacteriota bacterium]
MDGIVRYCVVKKHKGLLKRKLQFTHLFFIPAAPRQYFYVALIGQATEEENTYIAQLLIKLSEEIIEDTIKGEFEYFGKNFVEVEALKCRSSNPSPGKYTVNVLEEGRNIKSDLEFSYQLEYSTVDRRIYFLKGDITLLDAET